VGNACPRIWMSLERFLRGQCHQSEFVDLLRPAFPFSHFETPNAKRAPETSVQGRSAIGEQLRRCGGRKHETGSETGLARQAGQRGVNGRPPGRRSSRYTTTGWWRDRSVEPASATGIMMKPMMVVPRQASSSACAGEAAETGWMAARFAGASPSSSTVWSAAATCSRALTARFMIVAETRTGGQLAGAFETTVLFPAVRAKGASGCNQRPARRARRRPRARSPMVRHRQVQRTPLP